MRSGFPPGLILTLMLGLIVAGCGEGWYSPGAGDDDGLLGGIGADLYLSAPGYVGYDGGGPYYGYGMPGFFGDDDDWGDED